MSYEAFFRQIATLDVLNVVELVPEDIALCRLWRDALPHEDRYKFETVLKNFEIVEQHWLAQGAPSAVQTEGCRQQPILRYYINRVQQEPVGEFEGEELAFLINVFDFMNRCHRRRMFMRPLGLLLPRMDAVRAQAALKPVNEGLPALTRRFSCVPSTEFAKPSDSMVAELGSVPLGESMAPFRYSGVVKILGNVPERCAILADPGPCYINGHVLGAAHALEGIELRRNLAGTAVVSSGFLRVGNLMPGATAINRDGDIRCRSAREPACVFASGKIWIRTLAEGGTYITSSYESLEDTMGGKVLVTDTARAPNFVAPPDSEMAIHFKEALTPADYGGPVVEGVQQRLDEMRGLRWQAFAARDTGGEDALPELQARYDEVVKQLRARGVHCSPEGMVERYWPRALGVFGGGVMLVVKRADGSEHAFVTPDIVPGKPPEPTAYAATLDGEVMPVSLTPTNAEA